jgi:uncharacterized membrane protein YedE/YeeE
MKNLSAFLIGAIFGLGIILSGMGNPAKVQNFFDVAGTWDPSLAFVMAAALAVVLPGYMLIFRRRPQPVLEDAFRLPSKTVVDARLIGGAAIFGIGWGIVGYCPGGAIPVIALLDPSIFMFLGAMLAGMAATRALSFAFGRSITQEAAASG